MLADDDQQMFPILSILSEVLQGGGRHRCNRQQNEVTSVRKDMTPNVFRCGAALQSTRCQHDEHSR